ncbi:hypothetical protein [Clostridium tagluense]|uniref:hypothetical protein n=1 Tax=Clostridium tagluense TaxID=360422 RepID=UPI001C6EFF26|nr:hypothetical protein [Clostridium tagluense]MBW9159633.1 hypothetical protein [Clostridium tagluense]WLC63593.1 hypothetical protein KTC93_11875 [Clostridium tagluense]
MDNLLWIIAFILGTVTFAGDKENQVIEENKKLMLQASDAYKTLLDYAEKCEWKRTYNSEEDFSKAIGMNVFGNHFVHTSESDPDKFSFVEKILERSKNNIFQYLKGLEEYDLSDPIPVNNTIFVIKKHGKETFLITRPSDYGQVILYYNLEKDVLDYEKEWEL